MALQAVSMSLSQQGPFVVMINIFQGTKYATWCNRRILVDFSGLAEEALQDIPSDTVVAEVMMPNPVNPIALNTVLEWMHKTHGQRPTTPIQIPASEMTTFMEVIKVYQAVNEIQPKARATTGELYPWLLRYMNEHPLTVEEVTGVVNTFTTASGMMHRMCNKIAERGLSVYDSEMEQFNALRGSEPDFDKLLKERLRTHRAKARLAREKRKEDDVAMARDGQRVLSENEVQEVLRSFRR